MTPRERAQDFEQPQAPSGDQVEALIEEIEEEAAEGTEDDDDSDGDGTDPFMPSGGDNAD